MIKFSPGPWESDDAGHVTDDDGQLVCIAPRGNDARLIAAATRMYVLLVRLGDELARPSDARALVACIFGEDEEQY